MRKLALLALLSIAALRAEKRALLIGIGDYNPAAPVSHLAGPAFDLASMETLLRKQGFADVRTLLNSQATRAAILLELDQLRRRVRPGDYVVFYYSGHGTSSGNPGSKDWGLDPNTGALLPWDIRVDSTVDAASHLIVGKRDLRPVFSEIDRTATLFAIFDTCYSADAAKSAATPVFGVRFVEPSALGAIRGDPAPEHDLDADLALALKSENQSPYPYQHVISLAAAGKFQTARETSDGFDHHPHGVFTDALLRGMAGDADKNRDGVISHDELYNYLQESAIHWRHTPVMQAGEGAQALLSSPAFQASPAARRPTEHASTGPIAVRAENLPSSVAARIRGLKGISLAAAPSNYDLLVRPGAGGYELFDASDLAISTEPLDEEKLLARIAAQRQVRELIDLAYTNEFGLSLRMSPGDQSVYYQNQDVGFSAMNGKPACLLLLNIDVTGLVTVVFPRGGADGAFAAGTYRDLGPPNEVTAPFGIEYMKLFAFESKPADYEYWRAPDNELRTAAPGSPEFERLMRMLRPGGEKGRAETRLRIVTTPRGGRP
jgi:hypothetical protein